VTTTADGARYLVKRGQRIAADDPAVQAIGRRYFVADGAPPRVMDAAVRELRAFKLAAQPNRKPAPKPKVTAAAPSKAIAKSRFRTPLGLVSAGARESWLDRSPSAEVRR
jgi:hypothetical protein